MAPSKEWRIRTPSSLMAFKAAWSSYAFTKKGAYSASNYGAKLFNGGKPLSKKHRDSFPNPINTTGLVKFLSEHIKKASVRTVMNYFTITTYADINIPALTKALADQLQIIIHEPNSDDDIIATNYQQYLSQPETDEPSFHKPLYDEDAFWVETAHADRRHVVDFTSISPTYGNCLTPARSHGRAEGLSV